MRIFSLIFCRAVLAQVESCGTADTVNGVAAGAGRHAGDDMRLIGSLSEENYDP